MSDVETALALPLKLSAPDPVHPSDHTKRLALENVPAAAHEVAQAWGVVKAAQSMKLLGGGHRRWAELTDLRLTPAGIESIVRRKLEMNEAHLRNRFPEYDTWPDAVTVAVNSMSWACGANFHFPHLDAALRARDWAMCARECHIDDSHNPGVRPRNAWMVDLFLSAAEPPTRDELAPPGPISETLPGTGPTILVGDVEPVKDE